MKKVVAVIQARMASTRLPGKVMLDLAGEPMLVRVLNRTKRAGMLDEVVVATTTGPEDDSIVDLAATYGWPSFRGSEEDLLDRYYRAANRYSADVVVRVTSDCPLVEPILIDEIVRDFMEKGPVDYASNTFPSRTFPRGLDVEVIAFDALERAWREDKNPAWREHVTPYIYRHPKEFCLRPVVHDKDYSYMRWTVDTADDLALIRKIYDHFGHDEFSWEDVLSLLEEKPELLEINSHVLQKGVS